MEHFIDKIKIEALWKEEYKDYNQCLEDWVQLSHLRLCNYMEKGNYEKILKKGEYLVSNKTNRTKDSNFYPAVKLKQLFSLSRFQMHCILLALLYELNPNLEKLFAACGRCSLLPNCYAAAVSFFNAEDFTYEEIYSQFTEEFCQTFFTVEEYKIDTLWDTPLILNREIKCFLLSFPSTDFDIPSYCHLYPRETLSDDMICKETSLALEKIYRKTSGHTVINIYGKKNSGRLFHLRHTMKNFGKDILLFYTLQVLNLKEHQKTSLFQLYRTAKLENAVPCICELEKVLESKPKQGTIFCSQLFSFLTQYFPVIFVITEKKLAQTENFSCNLAVVHYQIPHPNMEEQLFYWKHFTKENPLLTEEDYYRLVNQFDFSGGDIKAAIKKAHLLSATHTQPSSPFSLFIKGCKSNCTALKELGTNRVTSAYGWDDIILTDLQKTALLHACNYIKLNHIVYEKWNFKEKIPYGKNLSILLEGPPGTGKTMAAQVLANDLGLEMYQIDISQTVSKYIGETEKKLNEIFNEAENCNAILFIDEMDAFFGKRTEIKDSHDKYANMETSFLLQKIESFKGILILATNYLNNIDEAFMRRIKFIISFPLPDSKNRLKIWKNMFPSSAPCSNDIDFSFLAENFELSGGNIKNVVLKAAFLAAAEKKEIRMEHILIGLKDEMSKLGKVLLASDFREYAYLLENLIYHQKKKN